MRANAKTHRRPSMRPQDNDELHRILEGSMTRATVELLCPTCDVPIEIQGTLNPGGSGLRAFWEWTGDCPAGHIAQLSPDQAQTWAEQVEDELDQKARGE